MAEAFMGLLISVQLNSGLKLTGTVAHIEPHTQQMTLKEAQLCFPGQPPHYTSVYGVSGKDIADLHVVSKPDADQQQQQQQPRKATDTGSRKQRVATEVSSESNQRARQKKSNAAPKRSSSGRRTRQQQQQQRNGWADEDVDGFKEKEFDFQANLSMFDKEKVFAEIRELDETAPETLLVTLNRLPRKPDSATRTNLLPTENVLDDEKESMGDESDTESSTDHDQKRAAAVSNTTTSDKKLVPSIRTFDTHISCIPVSPLQMAHAEHECTKTGPSEVQLIENGGRGVCTLALQIIGGSRRIQSDDIPVIVVLAGNNKTGAYGIAAARHLVNHGCHVVVCASEQRQGVCDSVAQQESMIERVGGKLVYDIGELNQWSADLIVDAMVGSQHKVLEHDDEQEEYESVRKMIRWASKQSASVLSIDFPSAIGGGRGRSPEYCINPQWTVCLGAPKTGCLSNEVTGTLYMADIGIPRICWKRAGVKGWCAPWGADFLVALEYVS